MTDVVRVIRNYIDGTVILPASFEPEILLADGCTCGSEHIALPSTLLEIAVVFVL